MKSRYGGCLVVALVLLLPAVGFGVWELLQRSRFRHMEADIDEVLKDLAKLRAGCDKAGHATLLDPSAPTDGRLEPSPYFAGPDLAVWWVSYRHSDKSKPEPGVPLLFEVRLHQKRDILLRKPEVAVMLIQGFDSGITRFLEKELNPRGVFFRTRTD